MSAMRATIMSSLAAFTCITGMRAVDAAIEIYPGPGVDTYKSSRYRVEAHDATSWKESYTYTCARKSVTRWHKGKSPSVNFTTLATTDSVRMRLSMPGGSIGELAISPKSKNIACRLSDGTAEFTLHQRDKVWIIVNGDDANPLFIFADPPKPAIPAGATVYTAGVHTIGHQYPATSGEVIYLAGGAWVKGSIDVRNKSGVKIMGPGVLSGELWTGESQSAWREYSMILGSMGRRCCDVQGITIVNSPSYNVVGAGTATDVKLLSPWYWSTDGFYAYGSEAKTGVIEYCFGFVGDDVFFPRSNIHGNLIIRHCFVGITNNTVFQMGYWGYSMDYDHASRVTDVDVKNYTSPIFQIILDADSPRKGFRNQYYEDIRIEGDISGPLLRVENRPYPWGGNSNPELGNSKNFTFKNITLEGTQARKSTISGKDANNGHHDYLFENLSINGVAVTESNKDDFFTVNSFTSNIRFVTTSTETPQQEPFGNFPVVMPARIQAEYYDQGGRNVAYYDMDEGNKYHSTLRSDDVDIKDAAAGNGIIGGNAPGEWREYSIAVEADTYELAARVSCAGKDAGMIVLLGNGPEGSSFETLDTVPIPNTGDWQTFEELKHDGVTVPLGGAHKILRLETIGNYFDIDWIEFSKADATPAAYRPARFGITARTDRVDIIRIDGSIVARSLTPPAALQLFPAETLSPGIYLVRTPSKIHIMNAVDLQGAH